MARLQVGWGPTLDAPGSCACRTFQCSLLPQSCGQTSAWYLHGMRRCTPHRAMAADGACAFSALDVPSRTQASRVEPTPASAGLSLTSCRTVPTYRARQAVDLRPLPDGNVADLVMSMHSLHMRPPPQLAVRLQDECVRRLHGREGPAAGAAAEAGPAAAAGAEPV